LSEKDIISNLNSEDAKVIGYTVASETIMQEKQQKEEILRTRIQSKDNENNK
jgi:hypothetical protein